MPFRAVHAETGVDHVLTEEVGEATVDDWRVLGRGGVLRCPVCGTPMRVRAGELYAAHFAHIHRRDCPAGDDTPELRALYGWLRPKAEARACRARSTSTSGSGTGSRAWPSGSTTAD